MVKPAGAKYDVAEMAKMVTENLAKIKYCPIHGSAAMPCRHCNPKKPAPKNDRKI